MRECDISLLIADYAPCALLAARGLGIPSIAVGTGYLLPPPVMESFPVLIPRHSTRIYEETEIVATINSVLPEFGIPPIDRLPGVYACSDQLAFTLDILDPYTEWRAEPLLPPIIGGAIEPRSGGDEIFVYFSSSETSDSGLMEAIGNLGVPVRAFIPGLDASAAEELARQGVVVERSPVPASLVAKRSRLMVNAAQHGTLCLGLAAGLPQICVPQQREQQYNAEAAQKLGVAKAVDRQDREAERFRSLLLDAYEDAVMARRAKDVADDLRPSFEMNQRKLIRRRMAQVMDNRV